MSPRTGQHARESAHEVTAPLRSLERATQARLGAGADGAVVAELWQAALLDPLRALLTRPGKQLRARMVELGFTLGGGTPGMLPEELGAIVELLHAGSLIVDDIEDDAEQRRGAPALHKRVGIPIALNAGNFLYFLPQQLLRELRWPERARMLAHDALGECLLACHEGQALDVGVQVESLDQVAVVEVARAISSRKTGGLLRLCLELGAIAAGAGEARLSALRAFGTELGVGLQMLDDVAGVLNPSRRDKALEDLRHLRVTWVMAWLAQDLDQDAYAALRTELLRAQRLDSEQAYAPLLELARFRLSCAGVRRARRQLERALEALRAQIGQGAWVGLLDEQLRALEHGFLQG